MMTRNFGRVTPGESGLVMQDAQEVARKSLEEYRGLYWDNPDDRVQVLYPAYQQSTSVETEGK